MDSSPLIIFGKLNKIDILVQLFGELEAVEEVYNETVAKGLERGMEDSLILKSYFDKGKIKIMKVNKECHELAGKIQNLNNIDPGEAQTIALAKQLNRKELIIDESLARETAKSLGLKPIGSLGVLLISYKKRLLEEKEVKEIISKMMKLKFRVSASTLISFWELFEKIKR